MSVVFVLKADYRVEYSTAVHRMTQQVSASALLLWGLKIVLEIQPIGKSLLLVNFTHADKRL